MVDNISDALIMAGAILIFVIALTVSMSSFTTMRTQIDEIIEHDSKLDLVTDESGNYLNYHKSNSDVREVGIEAVISSMYRITKENYIIYIAGLNNLKHGSSASDIDEGKVKLTTLKDISDENVKQYYDGEKIIDDTEEIIEISIIGENSNIDAVLGKDGVASGKKTLYEILKNQKFKEYLGVYQQKSGASTENKTTFRVITYVIQ